MTATQAVEAPVNRCPRGDRDCPHPIEETVAALEFKRERRMVDWLNPVQLARTGMRAAMAAAFGSYADKREVQAALSDVSGPDDDYSAAGELWFDYVSDLGDGFDATYSLARVVSDDVTHDGQTLRRGDFLVLGGDQVYPTAARDAYQNHFLGPYRAAFPYTKHDPATGALAPAVYAIPGNHDWYDGLTSFLRIFCQRRYAASTLPAEDAANGRWIGAWRSRQRRSYFAIRLPNNWWIWGIDSQLESDMDQPQLEYFDELARAMQKEGAPSEQKIILVTAEPSWVQSPGENTKKWRRNTEAFNTLAHFEKRYIRNRGFQLKLVLSGDLHHYVRYDGARGTTRITSGGGGAYLLGTEWMPKKLELREGTHETVAADEPPVHYEREASYPTTEDSLRLGRRFWQLPFRNWRFSLFLGVIYLMFAWLLQTGSRAAGIFDYFNEEKVRVNGSLLLYVQEHDGLWAIVKAFIKAFLFSPASSLFLVVVVAGLTAFTYSAAKGHHWSARVLGLVHAFAHVLLCCALMWMAARSMDGLLAPGGARFNAVLIVGLLVCGGLLGALLFAAHLFITSRLTGVHTDELFSSMGHSGYKSFLRLRLDRDGSLTVFTIGLDKSPGDWKFQRPDRCGAAWFTSETFGKEPATTARVVDTFVLGK